MDSPHDTIMYGGRGPATLKLGWSLCGVTALLIAMRFYAYYGMGKRGGWALTFTFAAWVVAAVEQVFATISVFHGVGSSMEEIIAKPAAFKPLVINLWITISLFHLAIAVGKVANASFILRLVDTIGEMGGRYIKWLRSVLYFICGSNLIITVPNIFLVWFQCSPPNALWDITRQHDCNPKPQIFYSYFLGAYAALSDFILAGLSIHTIYARHTLPLRTKLLASLLMGLGFLACAAAIARTYYSQQLLEGDMTYNAATLYQVGKIEEWGVLIGGCIPAVWPVMVEIWNKISCFSGRRRTPRGGVAWTGPGERVVGEYGLWGAISNFFGNFFHRMKTGLSGKGTRFATTGGIQSYTTGPDHQDPYASTEIMLQPMYPQHNSKGEEIRPERDNEGDMVPPVDFTPRPPVQSSGWTGENYGRQGLINTAEGFNPLRSNPVTVVQRKGHSSKGSEGENTEHTQRTTPASSLRERSEFESL